MPQSEQQVPSKTKIDDKSDPVETEDEQESEEEVPPYTLRQHCQHLKLKTETTDSQSYWYCDWTNHFAQHRTDLVKDVVKEYCQPFATLAELQELWFGISSLSEHAEDPLAVRTLSIRIRPDAKHYTILQGVHEAFSSIHFQQYHIHKSTAQTFQAIGADGTSSFFVAAHVAVHKTNLDRRLWIRFYHVQDVAFLLDIPPRMIGISNQKAPLRNALTPLNTQLAEACVLVQFVLEGQLQPSFPCPENSQEATSRFFQTTFTPSTSILTENKSPSRHRRVSNLFPSLANDDYDIMQESYPLLDRIWSELEMRKCTFNTLTEETYRFGMRPCQPTLDKDFCFQLSQISQQNMIMELQHEVAKAETILHDTLGQYQDMETLLIHVMRRKYNIPYDSASSSSSSSSSVVVSAVDIADQGPIKMTKRSLAEFPWHDAVKKALADVNQRIVQGCVSAFDPKVSIQMAEDAVRHVYVAFGTLDDMDQHEFLKKRNRQAMLKLTQQQATLKRMLAKIIVAPTEWPGLPKLMSNVQIWYDIAVQAKTSNIRRNPVALTEFRTKLGQGCITAQQLILLTGILSTQVYVFDWVDIDVAHTPNHPLTKVSVLENGKRVTGFNPVNMDAKKLVETIHVLKALQEA